MSAELFDGPHPNPPPEGEGARVVLQILPGQLTLDQLQSIHAGGVSLTLLPAAYDAIRASAQVVQRAADGEAPVYGVNTGFGKLANQRISKEQLSSLQLNLIRSHSVGVGEPLAPEVVRLMLEIGRASCRERVCLAV